MTRRLALASGAIFAITAILAGLGHSPILFILSVGMAVVCFAAYLILTEHGIQ